MANKTQTTPHVLDRMQSLKNLGKKILSNQELSETDRKFIGQILINIGDGLDPREALNIKGRPGERSSEEERIRLNSLRLAISWIELTLEPISQEGWHDKYGNEFYEGGLDQKLEDVVQQIGSDTGNNNFGFSEDNLKRMWNRHKELRGAPIELLDLKLLR